MPGSSVHPAIQPWFNGAAGRDLDRASPAKFIRKAVQQENQALLFSIAIIVEHYTQCAMCTGASAAHVERVYPKEAISYSPVKHKTARIADDAGQCQAAMML